MTITSTSIVDPDFTLGPDCLQGDLCITRLSAEPAKKLSRLQPIKHQRDGSLRILEGELSGHHHAIYGSRHLARFRDDGLARDLTVGTDVPPTEFAAISGAATLYLDEDLMRELVRSGEFARADLVVGFLVVEGAPVVVSHPEHGGIRLPEGAYYCGRQVESVGAEERRVAD